MGMSYENVDGLYIGSCFDASNSRFQRRLHLLFLKNVSSSVPSKSWRLCNAVAADRCKT
jgi:hypothetical protein